MTRTDRRQILSECHSALVAQKDKFAKLIDDIVLQAKGSRLLIKTLDGFWEEPE